MSKIKLGAEGEPLAKDDRVQKVLVALGRLVELPPGIEFATQRQEPEEIEGSVQPAVAIFYVMSPHPKADSSKIITVEKLISIATMPFSQWVVANKEYRHYANLTDPLRPIFAGLLRQHLEHRKNLAELN